MCSVCNAFRLPVILIYTGITYERLDYHNKLEHGARLVLTIR